jgi:hypothetical protein
MLQWIGQGAPEGVPHQARACLFRGEDCGTFSLNFIHGLRGQGLVVLGVNAKEAKEQRENMQASTDELDLLGIAKLSLNRRGATAGVEPTNSMPPSARKTRSANGANASRTSMK